MGRYYHELAENDDNKEAIKKAEKYLLKLVKMEPKNGVALVYYGLAMTMKARYESSQRAAMEHFGIRNCFLVAMTEHPSSVRFFRPPIMKKSKS